MLYRINIPSIGMRFTYCFGGGATITFLFIVNEFTSVYFVVYSDSVHALVFIRNEIPYISLC